MAIAGYMVASSYFQIVWFRFLGLIAGTFLLIASAGVYNNFLDQKIDQKMSRTAYRQLVTGEISNKNALIYGSLLLIISLFILLISTNLTIFWVGVGAIIFYVLIYGYYKRRTIYGTLIGTLPGSASLFAGYLAKNNHLTLVIGGLVLIMIFWQLAHFYAISIYRCDDYKAAKLPVWSVVRGLKSTKNQIIINQVILILISLGFILINHFEIFGIVILLVSIVWLMFSLISLKTNPLRLWAKKIFLTSLIYNLIFVFLMIINFLIH
jgi:protoheme IX farnesyltransferase